MNYGISVLFRAIPLLMALFCMAFGGYVLGVCDNTACFTAGPVLISLTAICVALFCTAATIIRQLLGSFTRWDACAYPLLGYAFGLITVANGVSLFSQTNNSTGFVPGHVMCGVGLIALCVSTVAWVSTRFKQIPVNSRTLDTEPAGGGFKRWESRLFVGIVTLLSAVAWVWAYLLLNKGDSKAAYFVAGHVMVGLACICTSLIALVVSILKQINNTYDDWDRTWWPRWVWFFAWFAVLWGGSVVVLHAGFLKASAGYLMIALGLVCASISSKVWLLSLVWKRNFALAGRIPLIPVFTAMLCFMLSAFLFAGAVQTPYYYIPARVIAGLGAVCFTLFSIVSILESGTSSSKG